MTTLASIGFNLAAAAGLGTVALLAFGWAHKVRHDFIAPRCSARPKNAIYNDHPWHPSQDKGNALLGWIPWVLGLSYDDILQGVGGTGTRLGGLAGTPLRGNLDSIVLLRFHALGIKVSAVATVLFTLVLLPMYWTSDCHDQGETSEDWETACATNTYNLTDYERTTIANVPSQIDNSASQSFSGENQKANIRLYFAVFIFWIIQAYLLYLLKREWIEILAMRRVYYLETDVFKDRKGELSEIAAYHSEPRILPHEQHAKKEKDANKILPHESHIIRRQESMAKETGMVDRRDSTTEDELRLTVRPPWIPHPEHRDTVPNVQLYSVLVGGLPQLPEQEGTSSTTSTHGRETMDWQLSLTSAFFDHCVPNQPGFSSSVAAVTILPSSKAIASAWRKWYKAAKKLRRLRFIRSQMAQKYHDEVVLVMPDEDEEEEEVEEAGGLNGNRKDSDDAVDGDAVEANNNDIETGLQQSNAALRVSKANSLSSESGNDDLVVDDSARQDERPPVAGATSSGRQSTASHLSMLFPNRNPLGSSDRTQSAQYKEFYEQMRKGQEQDVVVPMAEALTNRHDASVQYTEEQVQALLANRFGPEQTAIYSREFAQSAAPCCPNGCCERAVINSTLEELQEMEKQAEAEVLAANHELWLEQRKAKQLHMLTEEGDDEEAGSKKDENGDDSNNNESQPPHDGESSSAPDVESAAGLESAGGASAETPVASNSTSNLRERRKAKKKVRLPSDYGMEARLYRNTYSGSFDNEDDDENQDSGLVLNPLAGSQSDSSEPKMTKWEKVQSIVTLTTKEMDGKPQKHKTGSRHREKQAMSGKWKWPTVDDVFGKTEGAARGTADFVTTQTKDFVDLSIESQYAVVTFTSRQAAVAARQCLADGRVNGRWTNIRELPIPPLADAAACDVMACRNCCRPVTLTISDKQKSQRHTCVLLFLAAFYSFAPFVLSLFASLINPEALENTLPKLFRWLEDRFGDGVSSTISGFLQSTLYTLFFALCPTFFKALSNYGSKSTSQANAELKAMQYFWWFMVISAFAGVLVAQMLLYGFNDGNIGGEFRSVLVNIGRAIPSTTAATWLNWTVLRTFFVMTAQYLLQMPVFIWAMLGWNCMARLSRGGGPGPPTPYRIYIDSGMVLLSLLALAPSSPLVAPAAWLYFLWSQPVLRRCIVYVYRPRFDGGGFRWPFLFMISISSLLVGHITLLLQMILKQSPGPAVLAAFPILITLWSYQSMRRKFSQAFSDAALLQTSLLDGWDSSKETNMERREEFRQFLVDSHKASYIPVCLAGSDNKEAAFTAEPAVVVPLENDVPTEAIPATDPLQDNSASALGSSSRSGASVDVQAGINDQGKNQYGAILRRAVNKLTAANALSNQKVDLDNTELSALIEEPTKESSSTDYFAE